MINRPDATDLLEQARAALLESIVPGLDGDQRYQALMIANAMGIAGRESTRLHDQSERCHQALREFGNYASEQELAAAIASRDLDVADPELQALLLTLTRAKLEINNPGYRRDRDRC